MKELAQACLRTTVAKSMTKTEAAQQQLEGAIANLYLGNWACAITLAGAAEDVMPSPPNEADLFTTALKLGQEQYHLSSTAIVSMYNEKRNWLKHHQTGNADLKLSQDFRQEDAVIIILRAYTRFAAITKSASEHITGFDSWLQKNYSDWLSSSEESPSIGTPK